MSLLFPLALLACGGKRVEQAPPKSPVAADIPIPRGQVPMMRVLLQEGFSTLQVGGAQEARLLGLRASGAGIELRPLDPPGRARRASGFRIEPAPSRHLLLEGKAYRGALEAFINPLGTPVLVNELSVEEYLRGVVPNELAPDKRRLEAVKAQAVAARTFALSNRGRFNRLGFDIYADSRSQAYSGIAAERALSSRAVAETAGRISLFEGKPILAMYSSTCGGLTANYQSIFLASPLEYLSGGVRCRDGHSPHHRWEESIDVSSLGPALRRHAPGIGPLVKAVPGARDSTGRLVELTLVGEGGAKTLRGINLRLALGLRSNWILKLAPERKGGRIARLEVAGKGWGHGVGLCQYGAIEMASRGKGYREILGHYYPGTEVLKRY